MKRLVLLLLVLPFILTAAKAPDFTVTDFYNKTHKLYADYLDKDKVVVIKFFFVDCPPCNSIAPLLQPAYSRWGAGTGRVQFFEITTQYDNNAYIKSNYSDKYGITFPGIGTDGGSQAVVAPYKDNKTFGTWYGTPTFVVIAPNGEVNFNVPFGKSNTVSLDTSIAQALRVPKDGGGGDTKCKDSFQITVFNPFKSLFTPSTTTYDLYNSASPKYTLPDGKYNCEFFYPAIKDNYVASLESIPVGDPKSLGAISTQDIIFIQKYILSIKPFNNLQLLLADVNNNGTISTSDIVEIRKFILGSVNAMRINKFYGFVHNPKGFDNKVKATANLNDLISKKINGEFGIGQYGDVSGAEKIGLFGDFETRSTCSEGIIIKSTKYNNYYEYEINVEEDANLIGLQLLLKGNLGKIYDLLINSKIPSLSLANIFVEPINSGKLNLSWNSADLKPYLFKSSDYILKFKSTEEIFLDSDGISEMILEDGVSCNILFKSFKTKKPRILITEAPDQILISTEKDIQSGKVYSLSGQSVTSIKPFKAQQTTSISNESFPNAGIYFIELMDSNGSLEVVKFLVKR